MENVQKHKAFSPCRGANAILPGPQRSRRPHRRLPFLGGVRAPKPPRKGLQKHLKKWVCKSAPRASKVDPFGHPKSHKSVPKGGSESRFKKGPQKVPLRTPSGPSKCSRRLSESLSGTFQPGPTKGTKRAPKSDPKRSQNLTKPCSEAAPKRHRETGTEK